MEQTIETREEGEPPKVIKRKRIPATPLKSYYSIDGNKWEIGIDEAGRGPLLGRLYVAGAILPKDNSFRHDLMKDSKKFTSETKIREVANYIKEHATAWHVAYIEPEEIDRINIRQAVLKAMRQCARALIEKMKPEYPSKDIQLLIDGNDFIPYSMLDHTGERWIEIPHITIEKGDNTYSSIAAASILAKVSRDDYIADLCSEYPELCEKYSIHTNKGYGTKSHLEGIRAHAVTKWHRLSYAPCK
jgi:ribonuclease HII